MCVYSEKTWNGL